MNADALLITFLKPRLESWQSADRAGFITADYAVERWLPSFCPSPLTHGLSGAESSSCSEPGTGSIPRWFYLLLAPTLAGRREHILRCFRTTQNPYELGAGQPRAGTSTVLSATVSYNSAAKEATLNPSANLQLSATYVVTVMSGSKDLAGNSLDWASTTAGNQDKTWNFKVG
jgi:hypothetical protein